MVFVSFFTIILDKKCCFEINPTFRWNIAKRPDFPFVMLDVPTFCRYTVQCLEQNINEIKY